MSLKGIISKPKLREETFFAISFTVILMVIINYDSTILKEFLGSLEGIIKLFLILLPFFLMIFFSITRYTIDDPRWRFFLQDFIIVIAIITEIVFTCSIGMHFFVKYIEKSSMGIWEILLLFSAFINIIQSVIMGAFLRTTSELKEFYIKGNANKKLLLICGLVIVAILVMGKFLIREDPILTASLAISFSTLIINFKYDFIC